MDSLFYILAQESQPAPPGGSSGADQPFPPFFIAMILFFVVFYVFLIRGQRKDKKQKKDMLTNLAKNDRVMTIGGIIGTVVSVKDDEVSLKVDESSNTKITFARSSIQRVLNDSASG
jgi:preprotein translocase subunit YajC